MADRAISTILGLMKTGNPLASHHHLDFSPLPKNHCVLLHLYGASLSGDLFTLVLAIHFLCSFLGD